MKVDYSLYLVTDETEPILKGQDLSDIVRKAIEGGVTIVQYRVKTGDTAQLIQKAQELHQITKGLNVPLLINDRVDVAIAVGCEGVHIGQDDIDITTARKLLGKDAIIGVTASSIQEALQAAKDGADYLGLGTVFATPTKENAKSIVGCAGIRSFLEALTPKYPDIKTVCIGGINTSNLQRVMYQCHTPRKQLDGVAIVSAIISAEDPRTAAETLKTYLSTPPRFAPILPKQLDPITTQLLGIQVPDILKKLVGKGPLCHNMTNQVVQNFAANVAICIGASPIMSNNGLEAPDLAKLGGSLVINMGTVTPDGLSHYLQALTAYNAVGGPVLFDPVGAGATTQRKEAVNILMGGGYFDLIKGNEGEIKTVAGTSGAEQQKGVDSGPSTSTLEEKVSIVKALAARERNVVLMTGVADVLSDGKRTVVIENGNKYLGNITGSGCTLGTMIAAFLASYPEDKFMAALAGVLMFEIAAERAAMRGEVRGPGTFVPAFLDELYAIKEGDAGEWWTVAKVREV